MAAVGVIHEKFGDQVPYADPPWYQGAETTHYTQSHVAYRAKVRGFLEAEVAPHVREWDEAGGCPDELAKKMYTAGCFGIWPEEYGGNGPRDADIFHHIILWDEQARMASGGFFAGVGGGTGIGLPPVLRKGSTEMREEVGRACVTAEKKICLGITEPWGGSDVANLRTTARREGENFVVNGQKKFITGAGSATWMTTAVRTGSADDKAAGVSLLLIPLNSPGVKIRRIETQGWWGSYTAHVTLEDVKVPAKNLVGEENMGFLVIMENFNMERLSIVVQALRMARICVEDAVTYARNRKTFGKPLVAHQVIRHKIMDMAREIEACWAWLELLAERYQNGADPMELGKMTALLKVSSTRCLEKCAREACQVIGGASYQRSGPGERVERIYREVRVIAIGGGSEEIMLDVASRMSRL